MKTSAVLYGFGPNPDDLYIATEPALAELTRRVEAWILVVDQTWEEIRDARSGRDKPLYPYARDVLSGALLDTYYQMRSPDDPTDPPDDWWPPADRLENFEMSDVPVPSGSDAAVDSQPGLDYFQDPDLPEEIAKFAQVDGSNRLTGDVITYSADDLPEILHTAKRLGLEIRHDQGAFDRCRWDLLGW